MDKNKKILNEESQRLKEDLEDLEKYIREFSSFLPLAVCMINPPKIIIDINKAFENLTGYDLLGAIGQPIKTIVIPENELNTLLSSARKERQVKSEELTIISKKNKKIPVTVSVSAREDDKNNLIGYFLAITDITEIKKAREGLEKKVEKRTEELENSRKALMNILEDVEEARKTAEDEKDKASAVVANLSDGLIVLDKEKKVFLVNPRAEEFLSVTSKKMFGKKISELEENERMGPLSKLLKEGLENVFRKEINFGVTLTLEVTTERMKIREKELGEMIVLHDITREKTIERMKTEFVSLSAHQLRTPLAAIKWTIQMLLDGDIGEITPEQREIIEKTQKSNERMIGLINDLLDVTRIEEGRYLYKPILSDLGSVVRFVINSQEDELKRKGLKLEFSKPRDNLSRVMVDVEKMRVVVQNLLENAIKYTPSGGKIKVSLKDNKTEIEFKIEDSGVGIPEDQQGRVFAKFFRGANVIRMETEGSGLGIFISKNIVEAHGGKMWFESKEGKGATFYFTIPVKKEFEEFLKEF